MKNRKAQNQFIYVGEATTAEKLEAHLRGIGMDDKLPTSEEELFIMQKAISSVKFSIKASNQNIKNTSFGKISLHEMRKREEKMRSIDKMTSLFKAYLSEKMELDDSKLMKDWMNKMKAIYEESDENQEAWTNRIREKALQILQCYEKIYPNI